MSTVISSAVSEELAERIDAEREGEDDDQESRSKVVERLIRKGLEAEDADDQAEDADDHNAPVPLYLHVAYVGSVLFFAPLLEPSAISGTAMMGLGALLMLGAVAYSFTQ